MLYVLYCFIYCGKHTCFLTFKQGFQQFLLNCMEFLTQLLVPICLGEKLEDDIVDHVIEHLLGFHNVRFFVSRLVGTK